MSRWGKGCGVGGRGGWIKHGEPLARLGVIIVLFFFCSGALLKLIKSIMWIIVLNVGVSVVLIQTSRRPKTFTRDVLV